MSIDLEQLEVRHNEADSRFEIELEGQLALVEYRLAKQYIIYAHTEVPPDFEGQGIGGKLAQHVMDYAKENGYRMQALCPFINAYVRHHPEYYAITMGYSK